MLNDLCPSPTPGHFQSAGLCTILISLGLSQIHHPYWLWLTALPPRQTQEQRFTGFCPLAKIFKALGMRPGQAFS